MAISSSAVDGNDSFRDPATGLRCVSLVWLSDSSGAVSIDTHKIQGTIERVVFIPAGGGAAPTAAYDVTLDDRDGVDVLSGDGADLSATVVSDGTTAFATCGPLTLNVLNAGAENGGTVRVLFRP